MCKYQNVTENYQKVECPDDWGQATQKKAMETIQKNDCNDKVNILIYDYLCSVN